MDLHRTACLRNSKTVRSGMRTPQPYPTRLRPKPRPHLGYDRRMWKWDWRCRCARPRLEIIESCCILLGVETMLRHRDILLDQKDLSGRQARWLEKLAEFDFDVKYVPGVDNVLPDALSRMYEFDEPGTIRAPSEYLHHDLYSLAWKPLQSLFALEGRRPPALKGRVRERCPMLSTPHHHCLRRLLQLLQQACHIRRPLRMATRPPLPRQLLHHTEHHVDVGHPPLLLRRVGPRLVQSSLVV